MATNARRKRNELQMDKIQLSERFTTRFCHVDDVEKTAKPAPDSLPKSRKSTEYRTQKDC